MKLVTVLDGSNFFIFLLSTKKVYIIYNDLLAILKNKETTYFPLKQSKQRWCMKTNFIWAHSVLMPYFTKHQLI